MRASSVLVASCLAICSLTSASAAEQSPEDRYAYVHQTTNEVLGVRRAEPRLSAKEAAGIAHRICETLQRLEKDRNFAKDLQGLAKPSKERTEYHQQLANSLETFMSSFVPAEAEVLRKAKLKDDVATQALMTAAAVRDVLREPKNADDVLKAIARFREDVCRSRDAMLKESDDEAAGRKRMQKIKKWGLALTGVSVVTADIIFAPSTGGVAAASITIGGGIIVEVIAKD